MSARKKRSRARGALVVEMVVVTPLLALLCGFGFWFYAVHRAQMLVYQEAREPVWVASARGSGPGVSITPTMIVTEASKTVRYVPGGPNEDILSRPITIASAEARQSLEGTDVPGFFHATRIDFRASASMTCNDTTEDGQLDPTKRVAAGVFRP